MEPGSDRLLKRVWLVNGFILLALGVLFLGMLLYTLVSELRTPSAPAVRVAGAETAADRPRAIRYGAPDAVRGSTTQLVTVHHGEADQAQAAYAVAERWASAGDYRVDGPLVNVIFLTPGAPQARILLDRPAFIAEVRYPRVPDRTDRFTPGPSGGLEADSLQTWISYEIADRDTNRDGKLSAADRAGLFVSTLDGSGLRRVLPEPYHVISHAPTRDGRGLLVLALEPPKGKEVKQEEMRQRSFIYDVASGRLAPYAVLDSAADRAARIVGR